MTIYPVEEALTGPESDVALSPSCCLHGRWSSGGTQVSSPTFLTNAAFPGHRARP